MEKIADDRFFETSFCYHNHDPNVLLLLHKTINVLNTCLPFEISKKTASRGGAHRSRVELELLFLCGERGEYGVGRGNGKKKSCWFDQWKR